MEPKYSINSNTNSYAEKEVIESDAIDGNEIGKRTKVWTNIRENWDKYVYTFCILCNYFSCGFNGGLNSPAFNDLKFMLRTNMRKLNYMNTCGSVGYLIGTLAGFLYKYINRQLFLLTNVIILGVLVALMPECYELWQLYLICLVSAAAGGVWDAGNPVWIIELWGKRASFFLQLSAMAYGLGGMLSPFFIKNYLYGDLNKTASNDISIPTTTEVTLLASTHGTAYSTSNYSIDEDINYSVDRRSSLRTPFSVGGCVTLLGPTVMLVMFFFKRYKPPQTESQTTDDKQDVVIIDKKETQAPIEQSPRTRKLLIALYTLFLGLYASIESVYDGLSPTVFQYLPNVVISAPKAAEITIVLAITYTLGRFLSAFISLKLKAEVMITYHLVIMGIALAVLYVGQYATTTTLLYIGNGILGFGLSAMWSAIFTSAETYVKLTDKITALFAFSSDVFAMITTLIIGPLIEKQPQVLMTAEISYLCATAVIFVVIMLIVKRSQRFPIMYTINQSPSI